MPAHALPTLAFAVILVIGAGRSMATSGRRGDPDAALIDIAITLLMAIVVAGGIFGLTLALS